VRCKVLTSVRFSILHFVSGQHFTLYPVLPIQMFLFADLQPAFMVYMRSSLFWDANQLAINVSQHPRAKASCFWLYALHFLCWKIFKSSSPCQHFTFCAAKNFQVPHLICASLSTLRDNDKCLSLSAVHFLCCKVFEESLLVSTSLSVMQDICNSISLSAVQSICCRFYTSVLPVSSSVCVLQDPYWRLAACHPPCTVQHCMLHSPDFIPQMPAQNI
jgi:hypothetical protein